MSLTTIFEPLTLDEENERIHLERQVERAFYQAGLALQLLRDKKLYRSTHNTFQEYCQDRFGFTKRSAYYLIDAVQIVDNLQKSEPMVHIMPTSERQCRALKSLKPSQQQEAWNKAVAQAKGKVPSSRIVRDVVNQIKNQDTQAKNNHQLKSKIKFIPLKNPSIGQRVRIGSEHPLFAQELATITQIPNNRSVVLELDNQSRQLIDIKDLEIERVVDKNNKVTAFSEGVNYVQGVRLEWYVRVDEVTWKNLNKYAQKIGTATLGSAIARLLKSELE